VLDTDESSPALKDVACSGAELGFTIRVAARKADGACRVALLGVAEMTAGINNGLPRCPHAHACALPGQPCISGGNVPCLCGHKHGPCRPAPASCGMLSQA